MTPAEKDGAGDQPTTAEGARTAGESAGDSAGYRRIDVRSGPPEARHARWAPPAQAGRRRDPGRDGVRGRRYRLRGCRRRRRGAQGRSRRAQEGGRRRQGRRERKGSRRRRRLDVPEADAAAVARARSRHRVRQPRKTRRPQLQRRAAVPLPGSPRRARLLRPVHAPGPTHPAKPSASAARPAWKTLRTPHRASAGTVAVAAAGAAARRPTPSTPRSCVRRRRPSATRLPAGPTSCPRPRPRRTSHRLHPCRLLRRRLSRLSC